MEFQDRSVLVTGAAGGIGRATAVQFAREALDLRCRTATQFAVKKPCRPSGPSVGPHSSFTATWRQSHSCSIWSTQR
jgi:hypothetical protein